MSTSEGNPADPISWGEFEKAMEIMQTSFNKALSDLERRNDEAGSQRDANLRIEIKNSRDELATAINQLSEGVRKMAEMKGSNSNNQNAISEIIEMAKPIIQKRIMGEAPEDDLTSQVNQLGMLTVRGTLRELLNAQKLQVRRMMRKGDLSLEDVKATPVADIILDKALDSHARI